VRWGRTVGDLLLLQKTREALGLWNSEGLRVVDLTEAAGLPGEAMPGPTGFPLAPGFAVTRLSGEESDSLVVAIGRRLYFFGPAD